MKCKQVGKYFTLSAILYIVLLLQFGCSKGYVSPADSKESLAYLSANASGKKSVHPMRVQMLRDTALSVGARGGLAYRAKELNAITMKYDRVLMRIFNFNGMLLDDSVLPPVLIEGRNNLTLANDSTIRIADRNYQIYKQARFVTAVPIWRDYLILHYEAPEKPDQSLLPRNAGEQTVWKKYIAEGWDAGVKQADNIFNENLAKLTRDYKGMILYRTLLAQNMVSPPYVANIDLGVTGSDSSININDRVLRITAMPALSLDSSAWKTRVRTIDSGSRTDHNNESYTPPVMDNNSNNENDLPTAIPLKRQACD